MGFLFVAVDERGKKIGAVSLGHHERLYVLDGQAEAPVIDQAAWCWWCGTVVEAEDVPPLADVETKLRDLERGEQRWRQDVARRRPGQAPSPNPIASQIEFWSLVRRWRLVRRSPSKCLRCGSTDIVPIGSPSDGVPHPGGRGTITLEPDCHFARSRDPDLYTIEGDRITGARHRRPGSSPTTDRGCEDPSGPTGRAGSR